VILGTPPWLHPWPIGVGPRYQPTAANRAVLTEKPVGPLQCASGRTFAVHVELFANRQVVIVPRGIGVARSGCTYPVSTNAPTGVVDVRGRRTLGDLFRVWGRRLGTGRLLSFTGRVSVFLGGKRIAREPQGLRLTKHEEIVVEIRGYVPPHPSYLFPKGTG
jgi:hypothetical protein